MKHLRRPGGGNLNWVLRKVRLYLCHKKLQSCHNDNFLRGIRYYHGWPMLNRYFSNVMLSELLHIQKRCNKYYDDKINSSILPLFSFLSS